MRANPAPDRLAADPAAPFRILADAGDPPAPGTGAARQRRWSLEDLLEQAERRGEVIRARAAWIDDRRRELMERRARLQEQEQLDAAAASCPAGLARTHKPPCPAPADAPSGTPQLEESASPPVERAVPSSYTDSIQELTSAVERALRIQNGARRMDWGRAPGLEVTARAAARH